MQSGSSTGKRILLDTKRLDKSPNKRQFVYQAAATTVAANSSVPEFLYQLTKMLTDDNREIIEWSDGKLTKSWGTASLTTTVRLDQSTQSHPT